MLIAASPHRRRSRTDRTERLSFRESENDLDSPWDDSRDDRRPVRPIFTALGESAEERRERERNRELELEMERQRDWQAREAERLVELVNRGRERMPTLLKQRSSSPPRGVPPLVKERSKYHEYSPEVV